MSGFFKERAEQLRKAFERYLQPNTAKRIVNDAGCPIFEAGEGGGVSSFDMINTQGTIGIPCTKCGGIVFMDAKAGNDSVIVTLPPECPNRK